METLLEGCNVVMAHAPIALANNTDANSTRLDMSGYEGVLFIVPIEDSVATGVATLKAEENTIDSDTGMTALTGVSAAVTCAINDDINGTLLIVDVCRPRERYVQGVVTSATANIAFGTMIAIQYRAGNKPVVQGATVAASAIKGSPAEV